MLCCASNRSVNIIPLCSSNNKVRPLSLPHNQNQEVSITDSTSHEPKEPVNDNSSDNQLPVTPVTLPARLEPITHKSILSPIDRVVPITVAPKLEPIAPNSTAPENVGSQAWSGTSTSRIEGNVPNSKYSQSNRLQTGQVTGTSRYEQRVPNSKFSRSARTHIVPNTTTPRFETTSSGRGGPSIVTDSQSMIPLVTTLPGSNNEENGSENSVAKKMSVPGKLFATYPLLESFKYCEKLKCYVDKLEDIDPEIPGPHPPPTKKIDIFDPAKYTDVDTRAINTPEKYHKQSLRDLVQYLTAGYKDDLSKIRVIYRWITCQPVDNLPLKKQPSQSHAVYQLWRIKTKKGNYAQLVSLLCRYAQIPCVIIHGTLKGSTYEVGDVIDEDKHYGEWNAVLIDKHWRFINAYWGTCAESAQGETDVADDVTESGNLQYFCDENYFLTDPDQVASTHHPATSVWQLKKKPVSMKEFEKMTFVKDRYFNLKLKTLSHPECVVTNDTGELEIRFHVPRQKSLDLDFQYLMFQLKDDLTEKRIDRYVYMHRTNNNETLCVKIRAPEVGTYRFELVGKDSTVKDSGYDYDWIAIYKLIFTESMYNCKPYPPMPIIGWGPGRETEKAGLVPLSHFTGEVEMDAHGKAEIKFAQTTERKTTDTSYGAKVYTGGETMNEIPDSAVHRVENGDVVFNVMTPDTGEYVVRLFGKEAEEPKAKEFCDYLLLSKQKDHTGRFPKGFQQSKLGPKSPGFAASGLTPTIASGYIKTDSNEVNIGFKRKEDIEMSVNLSGEKVKPSDAHLLLGQTESGNTVTYNVRLPESGMYGLRVKGTREEGATHKPLYDYVIDYNEPMKRPKGGPTIKEQVEQEAKEEEKGTLDEVSIEDVYKESDSEDEENMNTPDVLRRRMRLAIEERDPDELKCVLQDMKNLKLASLEPDIAEGEALMSSVILKRQLLIAIREKDARKLRIALKKVKTVGVATLQLERECEIAVNLLERLKKLQKLLHAVLDLDQSTIMEIRGYSKPPPIVHTVMETTLLLLGHWKDETAKWKSIQTLLGKSGRESLKKQIEQFKIEECPLEVALSAKDSLKEYSIEQVRLVSAGCATFYVWVKGVIEEIERRAGEDLRRIRPLTSKKKKRNLKREMTYLSTLQSLVNGDRSLNLQERMMKTIQLTLLGVLVLVMVNGMPFHPCPMTGTRGTRFFPYSDDCEHYISCGGNGEYNGTVMPCPFATYWNQEKLTCDSTETVECLSDKCAGKLDGIDRDDARNCRGYWECANGQSIPKCCPIGEKFDGELKECVVLEEDEMPCNATCFGDIIDAANETSNDTQLDMNPIIRLCNFIKVPHSPQHYYEYVSPSKEPFLRRCPEGTRFEEEICQCDFDTLPITCKPDFLLTFNSKEIKDESVHGYYAYVQNVEAVNGSGTFNGYDSKIVIPRYNNMAGARTMIININFISNETTLVSAQGLVSNDNCYNPDVNYNTDPSIVITHDKQSVYFAVGTTDMDNGMNSTTVNKLPYEETSGIQNVQYKFINGQLEATLKNGATSTVEATGALRSVQCDLSIGFAKDVGYFHGTIDEISIYTCEPEIPSIETENLPAAN
ncbi:hypothetical protein ACF0H5_019626 [Mactra antiquata]